MSANYATTIPSRNQPGRWVIDSKTIAAPKSCTDKFSHAMGIDHKCGATV